MSFREAIAATPRLGVAYEAGLRALSQADRRRITVASPRRLCGSVNLDAALRRGAAAHEHVWDYGICYIAKAHEVHWIEVHPASDHGVTDLLVKVAWLKQWLAADGRRLKPFTAAYVWISSGSTTLTKTSPGARKLAQEGVVSAGRHYRLG